MLRTREQLLSQIPSYSSPMTANASQALQDPAVYYELRQQLMVSGVQPNANWMTTGEGVKAFKLDCLHRDLPCDVELIFIGEGQLYVGIQSPSGYPRLSKTHKDTNIGNSDKPRTRIRWTQYSWIAFDPETQILAVFESWKTRASGELQGNTVPRYQDDPNKDYSGQFLFTKVDTTFGVKLFKIRSYMTYRCSQLIWIKDESEILPMQRTQPILMTEMLAIISIVPFKGEKYYPQHDGSGVKKLLARCDGK